MTCARGWGGCNGECLIGDKDSILQSDKVLKMDGVGVDGCTTVRMDLTVHLIAKTVDLLLPVFCYSENNQNLSEFRNILHLYEHVFFFFPRVSLGRKEQRHSLTF